MTTYVYETIPQQPGDAVERFEVRQSMKDDPLTRHPKTGAPVRRVLMGGYGVITSGTKSEPVRECGESGCCCGQDRCCMEN